MLSPLQTEYIDIKFKELIGQGFNARPAYKGGLFEDKCASIDYDNGYRLGYVQSAIYSLGEETINTPQLLLKLIQENLSLNRLENEGDGFQEIMAWFLHPKVKKDDHDHMNDTLKQTFVMMCDSFTSLEEAYKAKKLYRAFLLHTRFNPWTYSKRKLPGYEMLVYLQTCEAGVPYDIEPEEYDFFCVSPSQNKFIREAERINRRKDSKRFLHLLSSRDLQDRLIQNKVFQNIKAR